MAVKKKKSSRNKRLPGCANGFDPIQIQYPTGLQLQGQIRPMSINPYYDPSLIGEGYGTGPTVPNSYYRKPINWSNVKENAVSNASGILSSGAQFAGDMMTAFGPVKGQNEILTDSGTSSSSVAGIGYNVQNPVDFSGQMKELKAQNHTNTLKAAGSGAAVGASVGSVLGPVGGAIGGVVGGLAGAIGGIFGGNRRKKKLANRLRAAQQKADDLNAFNRSGAMSTYLQQDYNSKYGNTEDQMLLVARGKDDNMNTSNNTYGSSSVYTSLGKKQGQPNARVAGLESIIDNMDDVNNTTGTIVRDGKVGQDGPLANLNDSTIVLGGDPDWRNGYTFRDQALPYTQALEQINKKYEMRTSSINKYRGRMGDASDRLQQQEVNKLKQPIVEKLKDLADQQKYQHETQQQYAMLNYKRGKDGLRRCEEGFERIGWLSNAIPSALGMLGSYSQWRDASKQDIKTPDIYAPNPYEGAALRELGSLRQNPYPIMQQLTDAERRGNYAINNSGGLSGAQKYLARVANTSATQTNTAKYLDEVQKQNNIYRAEYAKTLAELGNQQATRRQAANQYNEEYYARAHAAKLQGQQMAMRNMLDYINQYTSNEYNRKMGNSMLSLYSQDIKETAKNNKSKAKSGKGKGNESQPTSTNNYNLTSNIDNTDYNLFPLYKLPPLYTYKTGSTL